MSDGAETAARYVEPTASGVATMKRGPVLLVIAGCLLACGADRLTGLPDGILGKWYLVSSYGRIPPYQLSSSIVCWGPTDRVQEPVSYWMDSLSLEFEPKFVNYHGYIRNEWNGGRALCDYITGGSLRFTRDTLYLEWIGAPSPWPVQLEPKGDTLILTWLGGDGNEVYRR